MSVSFATDLSFRNNNFLQRQTPLAVKTNQGINNQRTMSNHSKVFEKRNNSHVYRQLYNALIKL